MLVTKTNIQEAAMVSIAAAISISFANFWSPMVADPMTATVNFVGEDANQDGFITASELSSLDLGSVVNGNAASFQVFPFVTYQIDGPIPGMELSDIHQFSFNTSTQTFGALDVIGLDTQGSGATLQLTTGTATFSGPDGGYLVFTNAVPEPSSLALVLLGLTSAGGFRLWRGRSRSSGQ